MGIGVAFYSNADGSIAGVGRPSDDGWVWMPANDAAERINRAIAILKNEHVAEFVLLPVEVE